MSLSGQDRVDSGQEDVSVVTEKDLVLSSSLEAAVRPLSAGWVKEHHGGSQGHPTNGSYIGLFKSELHPEGPAHSPDPFFLIIKWPSGPVLLASPFSAVYVDDSKPSSRH